MGTEESQEVMTTGESEIQQDQTDPTRPPWSRVTKLLFMMAGVFIPAFCFLCGFPETPDWRSGNLGDYAQLLLNRPSCVPQYPFLLYSMVCLTLLVRDRAKWSKTFLVRLGIYGGALIALEHWILFGFAFAFSLKVPVIFMFIGMAVGASLFGALLVLVLWVFAAIDRNLRRSTPFVAVGVTVAIAVALVDWLIYRDSFPQHIIGMCFFPLVLSTPFAFGAYSIVSLDLLRHQGTGRFRFSLAQLFGVVTWLAAHFGAWRASVDWMLIEYAKLPSTPPEDCYVCTAAARGHGWLTQTERCRYPVSDQMRRLKAVELILRHTSPRLHRTCRAIYDRTGPALAARLVHPWLADIAYLSLKPLEWSCWIVLRGLLPKSSVEAIRGFYGKGIAIRRT